MTSGCAVGDDLREAVLLECSGEAIGSLYDPAEVMRVGDA